MEAGTISLLRLCVLASFFMKLECGGLGELGGVLMVVIENLTCFSLLVKSAVSKFLSVTSRFSEVHSITSPRVFCSFDVCFEVGLELSFSVSFLEPSN